MDDINAKPSMMTRRSKRTAESPNVIPDKKQKLELKEKRLDSNETSNKQMPSSRMTILRGQPRQLVSSVNAESSQNSEKSKSTKSPTKQVLKDADKTVDVKVSKAYSVTDTAVSSPKTSTNYAQSPRRSSRTVIPNTRYKDMVDPMKKTAVVKTEVVRTEVSEVPVDIPRQRVIKTNTFTMQPQLKEEPTDVIEEVVTEETKIDSLAQMTLENEQTLPTSTNELSNFYNVNDESSSGIEIVQIHNQSSVGADRGVKQEVSNNTNTGTLPLKDDQKVVSFGGATPEPQVIVIPNESGKTASKIIIPKDPYRARLEQAFENNSSSIVFGPSTAKFKTRKLIVTPTHTHTSKKEAQKAKMARQAEAASTDSSKTSASVIYPWMQQSGVSTGQIVHTPEKHPSAQILSQHLDVPTNEVSQTIPVSSGNVNLQCNEEILDFGVNDSTSNKTQHIKIVYVKAKPGPDGKNSITVDTVSAANIVHCDKHVKVADSTIQSTAIEPIGSIGEEIDKEEDTTDSTYIPISEQSNMEVNQKMPINNSISTSAVEESSAETNVPLEQKIANTLCQVVEYKEQRHHHQPTSTIEYVLLDNKMVPIHKPYSIGPHGRIHSGRQTFPQRLVPGRIETSSQKTQISAVSTSVTQTVSASLKSLNDGHAQNSENIVNSAEGTQTSDENDKPIQIEQPLVTHGYIDRPVISNSPPQIVEISTEAFTKEVYGDGFTLDPASGELLTGSLVVTNDNQVMIQSDPAVSTALIQSEVTRSVNESAIQHAEKIESNDDIKDPVDWNGETSAETNEKEITQTLIPIQNDGNIFLESMNYCNDTDEIGETSEKTYEQKSGSVVVHVETTQEEGKALPLGVGKMPKVVKVKIHSKNESSNKPPSSVTDMKAAPVQKLPYVNITPVRAYTKKNEDTENSKQMVTKATETDSFEEENESEEILTSKDNKANKGQQFEEYIVVHLPEGTEIKRFHGRSKTETTLGEAVTLDNDGMYICIDCGHKTDRRGNWMKHRRKHLGIRPHACPKCSYKAATSSNLKRHLQIHDDIRNFQCHYCNLLFRQKIHLERHLKYKHEEKNIKCPLCDYVCSNENPDLKIHIRRRHMPHEGALNAFTCDICGLMTVSKKDLKQHMKFHKNGPELKLFCEHCSFVTDCVSRLRRHMLIHTKERPFQCGMCQYRASQKEHVLRHMRSQHGVEVERSQRRSLLSKNDEQGSDTILFAGSTQTAASGTDTGNDSEFGPFEKSDFSSTDKIFACNYCSMKFAKLINLYKHLYAQHKQIMPEEGPNDYQCVVCDFRTNSKKNLLVHMRKHNMQDHSPPTHVYSCVLCRYMNPRRRNLFQHMKKKHGIEIIMKDDGLNCYVTLDSNAAQVQGQDIGKTNVIALSDIVTTQTMDDVTQLEFIRESSDDAAALHAEKISIDNIDNIIPIEEMGSYVVSDSSQEQDTTVQQVSITSSLHASVQEHEAAEAIEGLQALAEQAGILETQNIDNDMTAEIVNPSIEISPAEIMNDGEVSSREVSLELQEANGVEQTAEGAEDIQLSSEQINQLSTGDYVEINGEVYKVEIASALQQAQ